MQLSQPAAPLTGERKALLLESLRAASLAADANIVIISTLSPSLNTGVNATSVSIGRLEHKLGPIVAIYLQANTTMCNNLGEFM